MKKITTAIIGLAFSLLSINPAWAELDQRRTHEITILCEQLLMDYAVYIDHLDPDGFASIFTADAPFPNTEPDENKERFRQYIRDHGKQAHMIMFTSTDIVVESETEASGVAYGVILGGNQPRSEDDGPVQMQGITAATEYYADFRLTDEGWKISGMDRKGFFRGPGVGE